MKALRWTVRRASKIDGVVLEKNLGLNVKWIYGTGSQIEPTFIPLPLAPLFRNGYERLYHTNFEYELLPKFKHSSQGPTSPNSVWVSYLCSCAYIIRLISVCRRHLIFINFVHIIFISKLLLSVIVCFSQQNCDCTSIKTLHCIKILRSPLNLKISLHATGISFLPLFLFSALHGTPCMLECPFSRRSSRAFFGSQALLDN